MKVVNIERLEGNTVTIHNSIPTTHYLLPTTHRRWNLWTFKGSREVTCALTGREKLRIPSDTCQKLSDEKFGGRPKGSFVCHLKCLRSEQGVSLWAWFSVGNKLHSWYALVIGDRAPGVLICGLHLWDTHMKSSQPRHLSDDLYKVSVVLIQNLLIWYFYRWIACLWCLAAYHWEEKGNSTGKAESTWCPNKKAGQ